MNEPEHSYEHELWQALADACNVPPGHFKTAGEFIDHVQKLTKENEQLKQVLNEVLLQCKEPSSQDIHAEPWIPNELGDLIRQKLRSSKT